MRLADDSICEHGYRGMQDRKTERRTQRRVRTYLRPGERLRRRGRQATTYETNLLKEVLEGFCELLLERSLFLLSLNFISVVQIAALSKISCDLTHLRQVQSQNDVEKI